MTEKEAYEAMKALQIDISSMENYIRTLEIKNKCVEALEKQIPKQPTEKVVVHPVYDSNGAYIDADTFLEFYCPVCGSWVGQEDCCNDYCSECGQKIDEFEEGE